MPPAGETLKPFDARKQSMICADETGTALEEWCRQAKRQPQIVFLSDADSLFYPHISEGSFTKTLHSNRELMRFFSILGISLAEDYQTNVVLLAALSQFPEPMVDFLEKYGWSWVGHQDGRFERILGAVPQALEEHFLPKPEVADSLGHVTAADD